MKISASIYSQNQRPLEEVVGHLDKHGIDFYHIDCNNEPAVFEDIAAIRKFGRKPVDLHIISSEPERFIPLLEKNPVEYLTFQYENLKEPLRIPTTITAQKGLAITSNTPIEVFEDYKNDFDFILIMATTPGKSGGQFDKQNFQKIRQFQNNFPDKKIHVDGGVNAEISFILRNMGVFCAVSGSFLFKSDFLGEAMLNLKGQQFSSEFLVKDIMIPFEESPILKPKQHNFPDILRHLDECGLGLVILSDEKNKLLGIVTNADIRKGLLKAMHDLNQIQVDAMINRHPVLVFEDQTVSEMLQVIKAQKFPISYLPVISRNGKIAGTLTFFNLIKGEL